MKNIIQVPLSLKDPQEIELPSFARPLSVVWHRNWILLSVQASPDAPTEKRQVRILSSGPVDGSLLNHVFVGAVTTNDNIYHVFVR